MDSEAKGKECGGGGGGCVCVVCVCVCGGGGAYNKKADFKDSILHKFGKYIHTHVAFWSQLAQRSTNVIAGSQLK